jgi:hypothetical protein
MSGLRLRSVQELVIPSAAVISWIASDSAGHDHPGGGRALEYHLPLLG